jgi:hypothetical protein
VELLSEEQALKKSDRKKIKVDFLSKDRKEALDTKSFRIAKTIESKEGVKIDFSKVKDLMGNEEILNDIDPDDILMDDEMKYDKSNKGSKSDNKYSKESLNTEEFIKEY